MLYFQRLHASQLTILKEHSKANKRRRIDEYSSSDSDPVMVAQASPFDRRTKLKPETVRRLISSFIVDSMSPICTVEGKGFKRLLKGMKQLRIFDKYYMKLKEKNQCTGFAGYDVQLPCRLTIVKDITETFDQ